MNPDSHASHDVIWAKECRVDGVNVAQHERHSRLFASEIVDIKLM